MPNSLYLAVETPEEDMVPGEIARFLGSSPAKLAVYPLEISYDIIEIRNASDGNGGLDPEVERDILQIFSEKDEEIADAFRAVSRFASKSGRVLGALSDPEDYDTFLSRKWAEAFATQGRSLTAHYTSRDDEAEWAVHEFKRALRLVEDGFHDRVGFFDLEQLEPSLDSLRDRIQSGREIQWVVTVDLKLGGNSYSTNTKTENRLENTIDDLTEYIRDLCIRHHNAPFQACPECAAVLEAAEQTTGDT